MNLKLLIGYVSEFIVCTSLRPIARNLASPAGIAASIIIVTRNKSTYLDLALSAIEKQTFPKTRFEVIIANLDSQDDTEDVIEKYKLNSKLDITCFTSLDSTDIAKSRNRLIELARGTVIIFSREDHIVSSDFVAQHLKHHVTESSFVLGDSHREIHTHLFDSSFGDLPFGCSPSPLLKASDEIISHFAYSGENRYSALWQHFDIEKKVPLYPWIYFDGGNGSIRRDIALRHPFAEGTIGWNCGKWELDCYEFALQLHKAETRFIFEQNAISVKQLTPTREVPQLERAHNIRFFFCRHTDLDAVRVEPLLWK